MEWMILPLKRYADFSGRSRRKEYWMFFLFQALVSTFFLVAFILLAVSGAADGDGSETSEILTISGMVGSGILWILFVLGTIVPNMAVAARRMHDQGIPGVVGILLYIATMILTFPGLVLLVFMLLPGKAGKNEYGEDPKQEENIGDVFS